ncbi:MAG: 30S ribosomal protein S13 [Candidatus Shikimatogenerans sp. Ttur]|uniref:Small ribosomal subunit protein uS13 n=1 Tax=Candidatus Shikimatogenerans sp. Ttur TaxID=3158569 RepID=A0AAU7ZXK7_9FLAO
MLRISGVVLNNKKKISIALTNIFGIGNKLSLKILKKLKINKFIVVNNIKENKIIQIQNYIENNFIVEDDLRSQIKLNIKYLKDINCYRGVRHKLNLPVRGQKTKNNSRTRKGKKKTVSNKKIIKTK